MFQCVSMSIFRFYQENGAVDMIGVRAEAEWMFSLVELCWRELRDGRVGVDWNMD